MRTQSKISSDEWEAFAFIFKQGTVDFIIKFRTEAKKVFSEHLQLKPDFAECYSTVKKSKSAKYNLDEMGLIESCAESQIVSLFDLLAKNYGLTEK